MSIVEIVPTQAHADLDRYRIVDVRENYEFHGPLGYVKGAELVPLSLIKEKFKDLSGPRPLLLICRSGKRSENACLALQNLGVDNVTNLSSGMIGWNRAGLSVVRTEFTSLDDVLESMIAWLAQVTAMGRAAAHGRIDALLLEAGASIAAPTAAGLDYVLDALASELRDGGPPPDLEIAMKAYRNDLAVL